MSQPRILVLYMGGTIGMHGYPRKPGSLADLRSNVPQLKDLAYEIDYEEFYLDDEPIDSANANYALFNQLAERIGKAHEQYDGIVVVGGTDTMAPTAAAISYLLENVRKPIIFTGSMEPAVDAGSDGPRNLLNAIHTAAADRIHEVAVSMWTRLIRATQAWKFDASNVDSFRSCDGEDLGTYSEEDSLALNEDRLLPPENHQMTVRQFVDRSFTPIDLYQPMDDTFFEKYLRSMPKPIGAYILYGGKITPGSTRQRIIQESLASDVPILYTEGEKIANTSILLNCERDPQQLMIKAGYITSIATDYDTLKLLAENNLRGEGAGPLRRETDIFLETQTIREGQEGLPIK